MLVNLPPTFHSLTGEIGMLNNSAERCVKRA